MLGVKTQESGKIISGLSLVGKKYLYQRPHYLNTMAMELEMAGMPNSHVIVMNLYVVKNAIRNGGSSYETKKNAGYIMMPAEIRIGNVQIFHMTESVVKMMKRDSVGNHIEAVLEMQPVRDAHLVFVLAATFAAFLTAIVKHVLILH
eukprot:TRINITY_DN5056_c0_g2_i2.p2 TRINITY_DN5056_c0_g2~~TRINITY_DN5056_c0_g2_i2.p2  ORF type:complete len:147 (+),score=19.05 TRINITY_DN5056_c0_g2_i2:62-502(+)